MVLAGHTAAVTTGGRPARVRDVTHSSPQQRDGVRSMPPGSPCYFEYLSLL